MVPMTSRYKLAMKVAAGLVVLAVLVGAAVVRASQWGPTNDSLTYAGTLTGVGAGTQTFSFVLHKGATSCAVSKAANVDASGAFAVTFSASDSSCLTGFFDGTDVTVDVSVAGVSITGQPVTPVPYAKYSDMAVNFAPSSTLSQLVPTGTVIAYAGDVTTPPTGWLLCDGTAVSRTTYAGLFAVIGISVGAGDGSSTFNLPDHRGLFLRGFDRGNGADPDGNSRTAMNSGGNTGDKIGTVQASQVVSHTHPMATTAICTAGESICPNALTGAATSGNPTCATGGSETRPKNAVVNYLIKD
jgi:microcystin-dependent protein